jgi:flagellar basal-body rod modification protein FlgD
MTSTAVTAATSTNSGTGIAQTGTTALTGLTSNFNQFLTMLMTQLQHQDPTQPLDANQFTTQLVQFSSVEQQIATNTNLAKLIQLTQASQIEQSAAMLGKPATVNASQLALQNGSARINFSVSSADTVAIGVYNAAGAQVHATTVKAAAGTNAWQWNGKGSNGASLPDGAYTVTVKSVGPDEQATALPFTVTGTVTSVQNNNGTVQLQMGGLTVPFSAIQSVGG